MKKVLKLALVVAMMLSATSLFAQKFGRIDMQSLLLSMPETKDMQSKMELFSKNLQDTYETMNVEFNTKYQDYMKNMNSMPESTRQMKETELNEMGNRRKEYEQLASQDIQKEQNRLMAPIITKAQEAVDKVAKAGTYTGIFQAGTMAYLDEVTVKDILAEVQTSLGIDPVAAAKAAAEAEAAQAAPAK
ncbi:MAG: OmpH family outer membrane protein [Alistipes sp.]